MNTALVCIAKNEDNYIDEWLKYHTKRGFSHIYVYQNNWRYAGDKTAHANATWLEFDGSVKQLPAYHDFMSSHYSDYDFAAFFDVDEYLVLDGDPALDDWLKQYENYNAIAVNWRLFGDSGLACPDNDYSCLRRFTHAADQLNMHIKSIVNFKKCRADGIPAKALLFNEPHSLRLSLSKDFTVSTDRSRFVHGPFNYSYSAKDQLNHYHCKTKAEYTSIKLKRGLPDRAGNIPNQFDEYNRNDIVDTRAKDFYSKD